MNFDDLDIRMRAYESVHDLGVRPAMFLVARLDGRSFARLTQEVRAFEVPFDPEFRDMMIAASEHLMLRCGFRVAYGYTQSDEICVALHQDESTYGHRLRSLDSTLAGEASAKFSVLLGHPASFGCRVAQLPTIAFVVDYLQWRFQEAQRSALNQHTYWALRRMGHSKGDAAKRVQRFSREEKTDLLRFKAGIEIDDLPLWQRRGVGLYWLDVPGLSKDAHGSDAGGAPVPRRRIVHELNLPETALYVQFVRQILSREHASTRL